MNETLDRLFSELALDDAPGHERLRLEFGYACVCRVEHLLEEAAVRDCLRGLGQFIQGVMPSAKFAELAATATRLAHQHPGSKSIDGCGHASVSATYAVANALAGKARQAAEYAAYAAVYGQGGYGAVADRSSFEPEYSWQADCLRSLASRRVVAS